MRSLPDIENDVEAWIAGDSATRFSAGFVDVGRVWVLKYFDARFLAAFLQSRRLLVSATPGFTWGDGVYVTPLDNEYSTMMYGRIGVMGWLDAGTLGRVYDAANPFGIRLYQEWIQHQRYLFRLLTTTIHADVANRFLRNAFRRRFNISLVFFPPDQFNRAYVDAVRDRWFVLSDWVGAPRMAPGQRPRFSNLVQDCRWVAVVNEQFEASASKRHYLDLIGPCVMRTGPLRTPLRTTFLNAHALNTGSMPASLVTVKF